jgi:hypothetical protein
VVRWVQEQHGETIVRRQLDALLAREIAFAWIVAEAPLVSQDGIHVRVAREHPGIHQAAPVHRVPFA